MDPDDSQPFGTSGSEVAIIGMTGRFPGAADVEQFWENLKNGIESVRTFSSQELLAAGVSPDQLADPAYVKASPVIEGIELFDASLFGISPREARILDPQHRMLLECAWEALERAGYDSERYPGLIGVFAGSERSIYVTHLLSDPEITAGESLFGIEVSNGYDYLATRISYELGLRGPSLTVQTACSTSLTALHLACQSLLSGECDLALAGGVTLRVPQLAGYLSPKGGVHSPDGHCRAFDERAQGAVFGSGAGLVVLKRLSDALAEGDLIHAVIKGSAINNDGSHKVGYTAPGGDGQAHVIRAAHLVAEVEADTITYVEAHGTGTPLGDPIEIAALTRAFRATTERTGFCAIGSVKTNIGHLQCAAGVAALIKTVLALEHRQLPPSLNFESPNPHIDFAASPFYVNDRLSEWRPQPGARLRAGVSSFGIGGTNAHVVLEEPPPTRLSGPSRNWQLLVLSAHTETALARLRKSLGEHLRHHAGLPLADAAFTLAIGRRAGRHRCSVVSRSGDEAVEILTAQRSDRLQTGSTEKSDRPVIFMFPGQGAQHPGMGRELYATEPVFRAGVDRCCEILRPLLGQDLRTLLYPHPGSEQESALQLEQTALAQPALFVIEHSLAGLWMDWGVRPQAMIGHSLGEYVAACLSGVFSVEDALALVAERGRLMQDLSRGAMLSVPLPEDQIVPLLHDGIALAAVNGAARTVVSGPSEAVAALAAELGARGVAAKMLATSHAFHSAMMEPAVEPFRRRVAALRREAPHIPFVSNTTGTWITAAEATDPAYWSRHLRQAVRFADGLRTLGDQPDALLLEVGPGRTLSTLARQWPSRPAGQEVARSLPHPRETRGADEALAMALGQLWTAGVRIDWQAYYAGERRNRVNLPTYPFERQRYWVERSNAPRPASAPRERREIGDWFYVPSWKPSVLPDPTAAAAGSRWLVLADREGLAEAVARRLRERGAHVLLAAPAGTGQERVATDGGWTTIDAESVDGFTALLARLAAAGELPSRILYLWGVGALEPEAAASLCFHGLLRLGQALGREPALHGLELRVVTDGLQRVGSEATETPEKALALGLVKVLPQEHPSIGCAAVDIVLPKNLGELDRLADSLIAEALSPADEQVIAYRGEERWVERFEPLHLEPVREQRGLFSERGVFLITGGLGGIGLTLARELARTAQARLVLTGRSPLPAREEWETFLLTRAESSTSSKIRAVLDLERLGAEVLPLGADVASPEQMREVVRLARQRFGPIQGVIHAAGLPGGGVIQRKTTDAADEVLTPKVAGTRVLASVLAAEPIEWLVLCSSTFAVTGGVGQVDYCAANCFLDAFARSGWRRGVRTVSLDWSAWRDIGMAAGKDRPHPASSGPETAHPFLDRRLADGAGWSTQLSADRHWMLDEHRLRGIPIVPGTAYLEMARAAFALATGAREVELRDVIFVSPLLVADGGATEVRILFEPGAGEETFRVVSGHDAEAAWKEHAKGRVLAIDRGFPVSSVKVADLIARCQRQEIRPSAAGLGGGDLVSWGAHWQSLVQANLGDDEALLQLQLPEDLAGDLDRFGLHPALLDVATAFGGSLQSSSPVLPHSYGRLRFFSPLPARFFAHVRRATGPTVPGETAVDVTLFGSDGTVHTEIERFAMRTVASSPGEISRPKAVSAQRSRAARENASWISPDEGIEAFRRVLARGRFSQVAISPTDLGAALSAARRRDRSQEERQRSRFPRPEVSTAFADPTGTVETALAEVWQDVLGLERVGIDDNFFDLGGDSVVAIQMVALAARRGLSLSPDAIFDRQTIRTLATGLHSLANEQIPAVQVLQEASPSSRDFSDTGLSQASIERLLAKVNERT